ncbi:MAG: MtrAB system histidine kinase MtrB [Actinomycetota bacterium]|nr:MtrAB system histidine kinase MtrB [Actinomycetota bacterium]
MRRRLLRVRWVGAPWRALRAAWRRSLQARVVIGTLLLSALVVALVGWMLLGQVTSGLIESKRQAALSEAASGFDTAQDQLDAADPNDFDPGALLRDLFDTLSSRGDASGMYDVLLTGPVDSPAGSVTPAGQLSLLPGLEVDDIPGDLRRRVAERPGTWWSYTRMSQETGERQTSVPALAVGSQLELPADGGTYLVFYVFPMSEQQQTIDVVRSAMLTAGSLLVLLVGAVAYLVIRQVVTPVGLARRIAERLAAGRLEERMHVRGEDDIARLGTSFNQMAASLQRQIRQLEELSRVQRRFVSDVSHELRTPLTTVRMAADVLHEAREEFDGAAARSAEILQTELDRFEALLNDLLEISRFDAGVAGLELEEVDLAEVARRVADAVRPLADAHGSALVLDTPGHPCIAQGDVRRVERIVRNLLVNAIEHGEGRDVEVRVAAGEASAALAVRDHGVGLRPGEATMVFNRFWRADPARARTTGSTGLGLAISLEDARLHGGWLQAWGERGKGAQFRLTLPRLAGDTLERSPLPLTPPDAARPPVPSGRVRFPDQGGSFV